MEDLGKLDAALHAVEGNVLDVRSVDASLADGVLRLRSRALRNGSIEPIDSAVCSIVWDHSEVGIFAFVKTRSGRVPYALLPDGRHEFPDLRRVLEEKPALAPAAFARLVDALQRRSSPAQAVEDRSPT
jgi:hypothetical protein